MSTTSETDIQITSASQDGIPSLILTRPGCNAGMLVYRNELSQLIIDLDAMNSKHGPIAQARHHRRINLVDTGQYILLARLDTAAIWRIARSEIKALIDLLQRQMQAS